MLTPFEVIFLGIAVLFSFLLAIYLFSIRINGQENATVEKGKRADEISFEEEENLIKTSKKKKKESKDKVLNEKQPLSLVSDAGASEVVVAKFDEEDDIIALASLKGYDTTGIRRHLPEKAKIIEITAPAPIETKKLILKSSEIETKKEISVVKIEENFTISEEIKFNQEIHSESASNVTLEEWSHVPTREEKVINNLKNKLTILEAKIEESDLKLTHSSRVLEQSQNRINLLERELKEQLKLSSSSKTTLEAQVASLLAINKEMAGKLVVVEADAMNSSLLKNEFDRSKEANSRLQMDLLRAQEEKSELFRQISELKIENGFLREKSHLAESLDNKCGALEEELEESRRQMEIQIETAETELKLTRAKLESEIAFHRAEHANSVGSSTALHQEIAQLKSEIIESETKNKSKAEELEKLNLQLLLRIEELESKDSESTETLKRSEEIVEIKNEEISKLEIDLEKTKSKLIACESEISSLISTIKSYEHADAEAADSDENISNLRNQLAEAEIKISSLQSDLTREIKRADIAKKVYDAKLAMLEKAKN
jgi:hypothetical protein